MPAQILRTTLLRDRSIDAAGESFQLDLPVNPLSGIVVTMKAHEVAAPVAPVTWLQSLLAKYTSFRVTYRGATIIHGSAADLLAAMSIRERQVPLMWAITSTVNQLGGATFPLLFGRSLYNVMECFPATRRGDLVLTIDAAADAPELDNHVLELETIELLDAKPSRFVKTTTLEQAMAAAGENTIELPIGNKLIGALLKPFTIPTAALDTSSFGEIALLVDNVEVIDARVNWDSTIGMISRRRYPVLDFFDHRHSFLDAAAGSTNTHGVSSPGPLNNKYGYLDWDPIDDLAFCIDTRGAAHVQLQMRSDVADGVNTSRVLPIEYVEIGNGGGGA